EALGVFLRPPVTQVPVAVELAALVVKGVRELVTNGAAGVAVVGSIVELRVEQRGTEDAGRKVDVVQLRVVVRINRRRGHLPLAAVHRLADLRRLPPRLEAQRA